MEGAGPQLTVGRQPIIDLTEWREVEPVEAALPVGPGTDQACVPQYAQMLRDRWLAQPRTIDELTDRGLPIPQAIQDFATMRLSKDRERIEHAPI